MRYETPAISERRELSGELGDIGVGSGQVPAYELSSLG